PNREFGLSETFEQSSRTVDLLSSDGRVVWPAKGDHSSGICSRFNIIRRYYAEGRSGSKYGLYLYALLRSFLKQNEVTAVLKPQGIKVIALAINEEVASTL